MDMCKKQSLDETKKQIMHDLKVYRGEQLDVCYQIYKVIVSTLGKEAEALRFFLENSELIEPSNEERVKAIFSKEEIIKDGWILQYSFSECFPNSKEGLLR